jgi:hypothetical protein
LSLKTSEPKILAIEVDHLVWEPLQPNSSCFVPELIVLNVDLSLLAELFEKLESLVCGRWIRRTGVCRRITDLLSRPWTSISLNFGQWNLDQLRLRYRFYHPFKLAVRDALSILCLESVGIFSFSGFP